MAVRKLKEVYEITHPGAKLERRPGRRSGAEAEDAGEVTTKQEILDALEAEAEEEA